MCGRYVASRGPEELGTLFDVAFRAPEETLEPDWNVAPTKNVWAVLERPLKAPGATSDPVRQLRVLRWGLVPSWAKGPESAAKMINARAETVHEKPSFRRAFATRRCLVPADGYYEWHTEPDEFAHEQRGARKRARKQPYFITPADGSVMAMAAIYEFWRDRTLPDDHPRAWWSTCAVLTVEAETEPFAGAEPAPGEGTGAVPGPRDPDHQDADHGDTPRAGAAPGAPRSLADIHPRMPLTIPQDRWAEWLDPANDDPEALRELLVPPPPGLMRAYPVSTEVSQVRNNTPELIEPLAQRTVETLF
ncbi:hypothetical protein AQ490_10330 [Wenjunlia vitaminophila]|uniref:Abasic site processing protein n=1 Tax=Wenjunlia vitaminophila TaxID=76728 RepID=A0A0T6LM84_WENVI|nr:SOS response-associated peptidase [Wenjunlia vitaminophila]KRV47128.1 hypothetical protein AQ490_10330 [Wenjunlia vitaminophila]